MASKKITVTNLDFDTIKQNLKAYLRDQTTFQDYDFEGSGLSVLLDILAYNTHYNALYNNLSINEMFLDSARKRNSVVSKAKELGYTPKSASSATAVVDITFNSTTPKIFTVPLNTPLSTIIDGVTYNFYTGSAITSPALSLSHTFSNIRIKEKRNLLSKRYEVADGVKFIIPNTYVDASTISVNVQETSTSSNIIPYTLSDNIVNLTNTSNVYWIKEIDDGLLELTFGDGVIGSALTNGNVVNIEYSVSSLDGPNGAKIFQYGGTIPSESTVYVTTKSAAANGAYPEGIESIRFNAPRAYSAQNRGVTTDDYKTLLTSNLSYAKSVAVWGGEDSYPPVYGKVFICVEPFGAVSLTIDQKNSIKELLASRNVLTVTPEVVDPEYINIVVTVTVYYNELLTNRTSETIKSIVIDAIQNYNDSDLKQFDGIMRYSKLSKIIDSSENSIVNNTTTITLKRSLTPKYNVSAQYYVNLINPIYYSGVDENIITSSGFYIFNSNYVHYVKDDGVGNIVLYYVDENYQKVIVNNKLGTVDYNKGIISFNNLKISAIIGNDWYLAIKPSSNDVVSALTQIAQISMSDLSVNVISDKTASGDLRGGTNYTFTTSRI